MLNKPLKFAAVLILQILSANAHARSQYTYTDPNDPNNKTIVLKEGFWELSNGKAPAFYGWKTHISINPWATAYETRRDDFKAVEGNDCDGLASLTLLQVGLIHWGMLDNVFLDKIIFCPDAMKTESMRTSQPSLLRNDHIATPVEVAYLPFSFVGLVWTRFTSNLHQSFDHIAGVLWNISNHRDPIEGPDYCKQISLTGECIP